MDIAKKLIASTTQQGEKEKAQILTKLTDLGLLSAGAELNEILGLNVRDVLNRRLQSIVFRQGLARSVNQARQFIVHRHIQIGQKEMTIPGYLVTLTEENSVSFKDKSALCDEEHPERVNEKEAVAEEVAKVTGKKKEVSEEVAAPVKKEEPAKQEAKPEENNEKGNQKAGTEK